jgi:1-acyl-sn-glycerol-3-phosphate acyltransferase
VLCCTHLSHLEPVIVSSLLRRRVEWMSRIEFYKYKVGAWALDALGAFRVKRQGVPVTAMRTAIRRAREGCIVGIFPEGGVVKGAESACRGGAIKRGACMAACEAGVPIVPVVVLGTDRLNEVKPWLPFKHGKVWVIFGSPIPPRPAPGGRANARVRKAEREAMARELSAEYVRLAGVLRERFGLGEGAIP